MESKTQTDTICALATPSGSGPISVIRISGPETFKVCEMIFIPQNKKLKLSEAKTHTVHFGSIGDKKNLLDEVLISVFRNPQSYTGEDAAEISCHGSIYIQQKLIELLISNGIRLAKAGEFTLRAFMNGRFDLSQAEAVADLIASSSKSSHDLALNQMRGGFSDKIKTLRGQLLDFASLIELELDFSEEDVEFADRKQFNDLLTIILEEINILCSSFSIGNVVKQGIPVAIIGKPNVGKSTLLNAILNEEKAIVSEIPGTTRDVIEDTISIESISFRFIDTAGLRDDGDTIEKMGIEKTYEKIDQAKIILFVFDISKCTHEEVMDVINDFKAKVKNDTKRLILIGNKTDLLVEAPKCFKYLVEHETIFVSAKRKENINLITESLLKTIDKDQITDSTLVSNTRHYEALLKAGEAVENIQKAMAEGIPSDLISIDIKTALHHLGEITGEITTDEILGNIFGRFCVGK